MTVKKRLICRTVSVLRCTLFLWFALIIIFSRTVKADSQDYGPAIEIGGGFRGLRMQSRPDWSSKYSTAGVATAAVRLYRGLFINAGKEYGRGDNSRNLGMDYGENIRLKTETGTIEEVSWVGARYDFPASIFKLSFMNVDLICASTGMMYTKFAVRTKMWAKDNVVEEASNFKKFRTATVSGPYVGLTARWRMKSDLTDDTDSWFGTYGLDIGVRYVRYTDSTVKHDNITSPKSNFNSYQLFIILFVKIKLLY